MSRRILFSVLLAISGIAVHGQESHSLYMDQEFNHFDRYVYQKQNRFSAYHNVRAEQGDTLFLYGDSLFYDGNTKLLRVRDQTVRTAISAYSPHPGAYRRQRTIPVPYCGHSSDCQ